MSAAAVWKTLARRSADYDFRQFALTQVFHSGIYADEGAEVHGSSFSQSLGNWSVWSQLPRMGVKGKGAASDR
jgi:hypothetical protein